MFQDNQTERSSVNLWLANKNPVRAVRYQFSAGENIYLLFNSDIVKLLLKTNVGRDKRSDFVIL